jgi:hypothetical protein
VEEITFDAEDSPATVLQLRYEHHDALVDLGVLPRPDSDRDRALARRERAHGFEDPRFCPDPFAPPARN